MMNKKVAGLIYGPYLHYLDHLAPLCSMLNIDLLTNEENIISLAEKYYPSLNIIYRDYLEFNFFLVEHYDYIISCLTRPFFDADFSIHQDTFNKNVKTIWCPHGNSDKGQATFFMEALQTEETVLVYGNKMVDFIKEKNAYKKDTKYISVGNFRLNYYLNNKSFYKKIIQNEIQSHLSLQPTILYAPTWDDNENASSFWSSYKILLENINDQYNIIIKLHPNLTQEHEILIDQIIYKYEENKNILFLKDFPSIYPLIDFCDIYLGDTSSIGYDFVTFNKPMFFLKTKNKPTYLNQCGKFLTIDKDIYKNINHLLKNNNIAFSKIRKRTGEYTFDKLILNKGNLNEICSSS